MNGPEWRFSASLWTEYRLRYNRYKERDRDPIIGVRVTMTLHTTTNHSAASFDPSHVPAYNCVFTTTPLTEEYWLSLPKLSLAEVVTGEKPALETAASLCWTTTSLHIRFWCLDDHVFSPYQDHDDPLYEADVVECFIDPEGQGDFHYEFNLSPNNVVFDSKIINKNGEPYEFHTEWDAQDLVTSVHEGGLDDLCMMDNADKNKIPSDQAKLLVYDLDIPFAALGSAPSKGQEWRINLFRIDQDKEGARTFTAWSPTGEIKFHVPALFGKLQFV